MKKNPNQQFAAQTRKALKEQGSNWSKNLSFPEAHALARHLSETEPPEKEFRLGIIHTYTSDLLDPWLHFHAVIQGIDLKTYHAPYGLNLMESQKGSGLHAHAPDMILFMLTLDDIHPEFSNPDPELHLCQRNNLLEDAVKRVLEILAMFRAYTSARIVLTLLPPIMPPALGIYDAQSAHSENIWRASLKKQLADTLSNTLESTLFFDMDQILADIGGFHFFDFRFWYASRFPFTPLAANEFARRLVNLMAISVYPKAKVIALDADNTLWGGIIGEDGINGIALGPEYPGNTFVDFQRRLLDLQKRGFILALCSKNNTEDVHEILDNHPHQILRRQHFAAERINWLPKVDNLVSLSDELNLGLDSFIFVDDSSHECDIIRSRLPQIEVIQTPSKPVNIPMCLEQVARLEILSLTEEDTLKTKLYAQEKQRKQLKQDANALGGDLNSYLASLKMKMHIEIDSRKNIARLSQLTQKTNQFNVTTRRYSEQQILDFIESDKWIVSSFTLNDIFGNSGIVGLALFHRLADEAIDIDNFLMSCRVIGRSAESAFLYAMLDYFARMGITQVTATYIPTQKNNLVVDFFNRHGFTPENETGHYKRDLSASPPDRKLFPPIEIEIENTDT
ncbi:MAG: HAD-IIIC family phosphatase [Nitrosomonas sp.]|nr:HAD-IIIC family phosphatase [Nitrosomonas sp.]